VNVGTARMHTRQLRRALTLAPLYRAIRVLGFTGVAFSFPGAIHAQATLQVDSVAMLGDTPSIRTPSALAGRYSYSAADSQPSADGTTRGVVPRVVVRRASYARSAPCASTVGDSSRNADARMPGGVPIPGSDTIAGPCREHRETHRARNALIGGLVGGLVAFGYGYYRDNRTQAFDAHTTGVPILQLLLPPVGIGIGALIGFQFK
jgi:hypothetical protein